MRIGPWFLQGADHIESHWKLHILPNLVYGGLGAVVSLGIFGIAIISFAGVVLNSVLIGILAGILGLAGLLLLAIQPLILAGYHQAVAAALDGQPPPSVFQAGKARWIDTGILLSIISVAALVGFLMCILPGVLVLLASVYALPAMLHEGSKPLDAWKKSMNMAMAEPLDTAILGVVVIIGMGGLGSIPIIGPFLALPLPVVLTTIAYRDLQRSSLPSEK
jgi:uncharacterized membrane protein